VKRAAAGHSAQRYTRRVADVTVMVHDDLGCHRRAPELARQIKARLLERVAIKADCTRNDGCSFRILQG
jgi:hypothetical protein